ncbi:hypothetical protein [Streptomyces sp. NPDC057325]|uniref:hypothetical protein n=1 Tax=unclassified Streptomyces TaxID=2593676 RepID=UPI00363DF47B
MKRCQACGYVINGEARESTPESTSGARPTVYWHQTAAECTAAKDQRRASPVQRQLRRL